MSYTDVEYKFKKIGKNVQIGKNVYFRYPDAIEIGDNVIIDEFCYFTTSAIIESFVHIAPHCSIIGGKSSKIIFREFSALSAGCRIICGSDNFIEGLTHPSIPIKFRPKSEFGIVELKKFAIVGTGSIVFPNITIEEGCSIGSMSEVRKSTEPWYLYKGNPLKRYIKRDREGILELEKKFKEEYNLN